MTGVGCSCDCVGQTFGHQVSVFLRSSFPCTVRVSRCEVSERVQTVKQCAYCIYQHAIQGESKYRLGRVFVYSMSVCVCTCRMDEVLVTEVESLITLQCAGWSWGRCAILPKCMIGGSTEGLLHTTSVSSLCHMHLIHTLLHTLSDIYTCTALINTSSSVSTSAAFLSQPILIT